MDAVIAENFLRLIEDSRTNGVPELHFRFWNRADPTVKDRFVAHLRDDPEAAAWIAEGYLGPDPDFGALAATPDGTLGREFERHVTENHLNKTIAAGYRHAHQELERAGKIGGMPDEVTYAVVRGFQMHDIFHVLTGYRTNGWGEMALQAFTLAQRPLPYSSIWMATLTAQMTFENADMVVPVMDALSLGWQAGRGSRNLNYTRWEERFGEQVRDLRAEYGIPAEGLQRPRRAATAA